jgi:hypothetical protein
VSKKTAAELRAEVTALKRMGFGQTVGGVVITLINGGVIGWVAYMGYLIVLALAGQQTKAAIGIRILANVRLSAALGWGVGAGGAGYGLLQRRLKGRDVARLSGRIHELEMEKDPGRTSSRLTKQGTTNPGDIP